MQHICDTLNKKCSDLLFHSRLLGHEYVDHVEEPHTFSHAPLLVLLTLSSVHPIPI